MEQKISKSALDRLGITRREWLKALAGIPVLIGFIFAWVKKIFYDRSRKRQLLEEFSESGAGSVTSVRSESGAGIELIRIGIIGFGTRGEQLARALGFAHPEWIASVRQQAEQNRLNRTWQDWELQEPLYVVITGICDVFDLRAERGLALVPNSAVRNSVSGSLPRPKRFWTYQELLSSDEIDAVIIATPDFHHAQMTIDAANAGKHIYCEKCLTRTEDELHNVVAAVKASQRRNGIIFQLGHQYHQSEAFAKAREIVAKNILGKITLVETTTNRNTPDGAWIRHLDANGNPKPGDPQSIDWDQWLGPSPKVPFNIDRFYNWTKWWAYGTGLSGQLLSHEIDAVNQILGTGIPKYCMASGGIYFYKDNREIPDVFHAVFEFPEKQLTMIYSASLASSVNRGRIFMGHDGSMELGASLTVMADRESTRYIEKIRQGILDPSLPLFAYRPGLKSIDPITSASEKFYLDRGLTYTYRNGKPMDVSHLHLKEWLECIRSGNQPSCDIDKGFEVTIACHMATRSYLEQRRVEWDPVQKRII
ncbi:MAG: Gfo/Idh/MocA family oxidoreductase [candidate division KSB1 bacterium]|nr:Gfo/Idh/MocA family oxidoreductase [candidate division KSB1 bacterium]MDZ7335924.1 Gfo/Idh/MocA family oxidoreductase [candidate division KSB1 bacterium]MDZ7356785.1 Gfo/Idh/MocA family oxidoreductase [candidate division KSB1 bacterium]MDZ7375017.1 Gfo/Idh/MocA family oxidoreductase [candidate division KSB1 bacterium]MDZ7401256.1 Gfo/Idh/MocA family oxidoreductase [candidate division KSB1 bacterium]